MTTTPRQRDAFGQALLDFLDGRTPETLPLETDDGVGNPAMEPAWFFQAFDRWVEWEQRVLRNAAAPVLDLGAGAGRTSLYLQQRGLHVTAVDSSPGAVEVCRRRGVRDARLQDFVTELPDDREWSTVLLLCGNLGLAGSWDGTRRLLKRLHTICADNAVILADTIDPTLIEDEQVRAYQQRMLSEGEYVGNVRLRLRYGEMTTPFWGLTNILIADVPQLINETGWMLEDHHVADVDHYLCLRRI